jgi:hypothetical protein
MKTNKDSLKSAMDRRLSFLDDVPSCRAAVQYRIAQEEEPVMKKKISVGFVFAMILALLSAAALATTLLLSPRASASRIADQALEKEYGITAEMQSFFHREEEELADGTIKVTYTGNSEIEFVLGTYTALVKDGKAEMTWSHAGEDTSGGYEAKAWGLEQLKQMVTDSQDEKTKEAYLDKAREIAEKNGTVMEDESSSEAIENWFEVIEARKTKAMNARKVSEEEMINTGREFIISTYGLNKEQISRMELYTNFDLHEPGAEDEGNGNGWYDMIDGKPCFIVEYLLGQDEVPETEGTEVTPPPRGEKDGYYVVYVNVETGEIENYEYNSGLSGRG